MIRLRGLMSLVLASLFLLLVAGKQVHETRHRSPDSEADMQAADEASKIVEQVTRETDKQPGEKTAADNAPQTGKPPAVRMALLGHATAPVVSVVATKTKHVKHSRKSVSKTRHNARKHSSKKKAKSNRQPAEQAALDAANAHTAAESAKQAAHVAREVAVHTVHLTEHAKSALKSAKDAVHKARVDTHGLSSDQKESLQSAEARLQEASKDTEYGTLKDARYVNASVANHDLDKLQNKLETQENEKMKRMSELEQMRQELKELREDLQKKTGRKAGSAKAPLEEEVAIKELEDMIKKLEEEEAAGNVQGSKSHDELKVEMEKLRESVDRLETKQLEYSLPAKGASPEAPPQPRDGPLVHELPTVEDTDEEQPAGHKPTGSPSGDLDDDSDKTPPAAASVGGDSPGDSVTPLGSMDIDTQMPYGDLEPFGREDTAQELTESSIRESDEMVDQLERAEVAEEKRAVFRALTRLRGAAITSFDGVARSQTGNIDEYNKVHKWRNTHPLHHLADEESDISKWAFPDNADF
mmetsp:Transcript_2505/g.4151  ORF Transcript_2505/g.4151 Transcript_2505/m.4151 type:complete len:527 (-) Transcript_2505:37-1617(-)